MKKIMYDIAKMVYYEVEMDEIKDKEEINNIKTMAICNKCGCEFEIKKEEIEFNDDGFGFVYCPFCENDQVDEFKDVRG